MKQSKIMELLQEAADPTCSNERLAQIIAQLRSATSAVKRAQWLPRRCAENGIEAMVSQAFDQAVDQGKAWMLPQLFPLFALACGDRQRDSAIAHIDWSIIT